MFQLQLSDELEVLLAMYLGIGRDAQAAVEGAGGTWATGTKLCWERCVDLDLQRWEADAAPLPFQIEEWETKPPKMTSVIQHLRKTGNCRHFHAGGQTWSCWVFGKCLLLLYFDIWRHVLSPIWFAWSQISHRRHGVLYSSAEWIFALGSVGSAVDREKLCATGREASCCCGLADGAGAFQCPGPGVWRRHHRAAGRYLCQLRSRAGNAGEPAVLCSVASLGADRCTHRGFGGSGCSCTAVVRWVDWQGHCPEGQASRTREEGADWNAAEASRRSSCCGGGGESCQGREDGDGREGEICWSLRYVDRLTWPDKVRESDSSQLRLQQKVDTSS